MASLKRRCRGEKHGLHGGIALGKYLRATWHEISVCILFLICYSFLTYELYCGLASRYNQGKGTMIAGSQGMGDKTQALRLHCTIAKRAKQSTETCQADTIKSNGQTLQKPLSVEENGECFSSSNVSDPTFAFSRYRLFRNAQTMLIDIFSQISIENHTRHLF